ncbi:MAG: hypothetical protein WBG36_15680, partial [Ornithinimicrobium sp.]
MTRHAAPAPCRWAMRSLTLPIPVLLLFVLLIVFMIINVILKVDSYDSGSTVRARPVRPRPGRSTPAERRRGSERLAMATRRAEAIRRPRRLGDAGPVPEAE